MTLSLQIYYIIGRSNNTEKSKNMINLGPNLGESHGIYCNIGSLLVKSYGFSYTAKLTLTGIIMAFMALIGR